MSDKISKACDKALIDLAEGNDNALNTIYDCTARLIFSVAYSILKNHHDAEDVLQDTMINIFRYARTYKQGNNAKAWIIQIARNIAIDKVKRRKTTVSLEVIRELEDNGEEEIYAEHEEVFRMLDILEEDDRQIVLLRLYDELSYKEIAAVMCIPISTAQKKYQRALNKLKKEYNSSEKSKKEALL